MLIRVVYQDNTYDFMNPARLDQSLKAGTISRFQRSSGWARVGIDPLRTQRNDAHQSTHRDKAAERRHA
jgi:hypothetical protein